MTRETPCQPPKTGQHVTPLKVIFLADTRPGHYHLSEGVIDRLRTGASRALGAVIPPARLLDSSPYDRAMRRFHNFMKDTPSFQSTSEGHREFRFKPFTAWMVFTDMVSHACIEGRFAFIDTFVIRLKSCRLPEMAPIQILQKGA